MNADTTPASAGAPVRLSGLEFGLMIAIVLADQLTKALVRAEIPIDGSIPIIGTFLNLTHVRNSGAAFGILNGVDFPYKSAILALVATAALMGIAWYAARGSAHQRVARAGLAMIMAGAVGNLIDRLAFGAVVDFVDVVFGAWHFWAFNVADAAITLGVTALILDMMGTGRHASKTS